MAIPQGRMAAARLAALGRIAEARRDADLARLSAVSARLSSAVEARATLDAALSAEIRLALCDPEVPVLRALDQHVILAEQARTTLEARIADLTTEREAERARTALSFGRAMVLDRLADAARQSARKPATQGTVASDHE